MPEITARTEFSGPLLRQIREAIGIELREIAEKSKIGMAYLQALEGEVFTKLPAPVYVRGFLAEYARASASTPNGSNRPTSTAIAQRVARRRAGSRRGGGKDLAAALTPVVTATYDRVMATLIDNPKRARQLARAIASDLTLYHEPKILEGIANDNLFEVMSDEINEGRELFKSRVTEDIFGQHIYERAIVDVLIKSKGHVKSKIW